MGQFWRDDALWEKPDLEKQSKNGQGKCCLVWRRQSGVGHQPPWRAVKFSPPFDSTPKKPASEIAAFLAA